MPPRSDFLGAYFAAELDEHLAVATATKRDMAADFARLVDICARAIDAGGQLLFFGNGGSAADAQHIATEFSVRFRTNRRALPALALTTDAPTLTAIGNDLGFDRIFARQIEAHGRKGDVAVGISTSGRSANVLLGLAQARELGLTAAGFGGGDGGQMVGAADPLLLVPSRTTARIQEMHHMLGQMLCGAVEIALGLVPAAEGR
jgi:D-sedoheptulose 7-phosphate isomerase